MTFEGLPFYTSVCCHCYDISLLFNVVGFLFSVKPDILALKNYFLSLSADFLSKMYPEF